MASSIDERGRRPHRIETLGGLTRRSAQLGYLATHYRAHARYAREIEQFVVRGLTSPGVFQRYKYLGGYLARSLSRSVRRGMILAHYRFTDDRVDRDAHGRLRRDGVVIWRGDGEGHDAVITLTTAQRAPMEGEWQLQYDFAGKTISTLSFLFAPLPRSDESGGIACLIGGVQGGRDCRFEIRQAAKANHEIAAPAMLLLTCRGIAAALGVETFCGVSSRDRIASLYAGDELKADYDKFWAAEGATRIVGGFHLLSHPPVERDLSAVARTHRRRTKIKRAYKAALLKELTDASARLLACQPAWADRPGYA